MFGYVNHCIYICLANFEFYSMRDRIQALLENEQMTNKQFADAVGINPAAVSHLLAGRNKPSFDLVYKILGAFPSLNADWLIMGKEPMYKEGSTLTHTATPSATTSAPLEPDLFSLHGISVDDSNATATEPSRSVATQVETPVTPEVSEPAASSVSDEPPVASVHPTSDMPPAPQTIIREVIKEQPARKIVRVVVYFDDNTYEDFSSAGM